MSDKGYTDEEDVVRPVGGAHPCLRPYWVTGVHSRSQAEQCGSTEAGGGDVEESGSERQEDMSSWGRKSF